MEIVIVTSESERQDIKRTIDACLDVGSGKMTRDEFSREYPAKVWLDFTGEPEGKWTVVDNTGGECYVESFRTLDGALLYATRCKMTACCAGEWDRVGEAERIGGFTGGCEDDE